MDGLLFGESLSHTGKSHERTCGSHAEDNRVDYGCAGYTNDMQFRFPIGKASYFFEMAEMLLLTCSLALQMLFGIILAVMVICKACSLNPYCTCEVRPDSYVQFCPSRLDGLSRDATMTRPRRSLTGSLQSLRRATPVTTRLSAVCSKVS